MTAPAEPVAAFTTDAWMPGFPTRRCAATPPMKALVKTTASRSSARQDALTTGSETSPGSPGRTGCSYVRVDMWIRASRSETLRSMDERLSGLKTDAAAIRLVLVDDHTMLRHGLRQTLQQHGLDIVGEASNGRAGVELMLALKPDVVV